MHKRNSKGYPLNAEAGICPHYAKTGECKFSFCKFDHPESVLEVLQRRAQLQSAAPVVEEAVKRNSKGYPLRQDAVVCQYYAKTGKCKFASSCKFDHPE